MHCPGENWNCTESDCGGNVTISVLLSDTISEIKEDGSNVKDIVQEIASTDDKTAWIKSLVKVAGNEGFEIGKGYFAGALSKGLMVKHLTINDEIDCDRNLRDMGVIDGLDGLNLNSSSIYTNGTEDITLICKYKVKLLNLLNNDITFSFVQTAKTKAWGAQALVSSDKEDDSNAVEGDKVTLVGAGEGEKFGEYAAKAKPVDGYVDVIIHASSDGKMQIYANGAWVDINSKNFEKIMKNRGLEGKNIRLVSCGAGAVDSGIANSVADRLNVNVLAPTDTVWAYPDGTLTVGPTADSNTGEWIVQHGMVKNCIGSWIIGDKPWMAHEWLFGVLIYLVSCMGMRWIVIGCHLLYLIVVYLCCKQAGLFRKNQNPPALYWMLVLLPQFAVYANMTVARPQYGG